MSRSTARSKRQCFDSPGTGQNGLRMRQLRRDLSQNAVSSHTIPLSYAGITQIRFEGTKADNRFISARKGAPSGFPGTTIPPPETIVNLYCGAGGARRSAAKSL